MPVIAQTTAVLFTFFLLASSSSADPVDIPYLSLRNLLLKTIQANGVESEVIDSKDLQAICFLDGSHQQIKDLSGLQYCINLRELRLGDNQLTELNALSTCTLMKSLDLSNNAIKDITPLKSMERLRFLNLDNNQIQDLTPIAGMKLLTSVYASSNNLSQLEPLRQITRLHSLFLANNSIEDISALSSLLQLTTLDLRQNKIVNTESLRPLKNLMWTFLSNNQITDITSLADMAQIDAGYKSDFARSWRLYPEGNPLSAESIQAIRLLQNCGAKVISQPSAPTSEQQDQKPADVTTQPLLQNENESAVPDNDPVVPVPTKT